MNEFIFKRKIDFYDCDPAGILFFGRIYEICHAAYEALIESLNPEVDYWNNDDFVVPIIHSEASYHKPVKYGEELEIEIKVKQLRDSSFEIEYECRNEKREKTHKVKTVHVFIDKSTWKKKPMSEEIKAGLRKYSSAK